MLYSNSSRIQMHPAHYAADCLYLQEESLKPIKYGLKSVSIIERTEQRGTSPYFDRLL